MYTYNYEQLGKQVLQPAMGHGTDTSEQGGEQVPMPVRYDVRKGKQVRGAAGRTRGVPRNSASLHETLQQKAMEQKTEREAPKSVRQHFVLSTRDPPYFFFLFLFIAREEAVWH